MATLSSSNINPILVRDARVRWRGNRAFWMAFIYTTVLASAMMWRYLDFHSDSRGEDALPFLRAAQLGHDLFLMLTWMQALGWMLLAPALTATSIAGERESGLLESIQLSHLTTWQIITGKLLSALSFVVLMIVISLPITAVCFVLGGVSDGEFRAALALHLTTAVTGAAVGLAASASYRRASTAMAMTFIFMLLWGIASLISFVYAQMGAMAGVPAWAIPILEIFGWTNPIIAAYDLAEPLRGIGMTTSFFDWPGWLICIAAQGLFTLSRLWQTARALKKPMEDWWNQAEKTPKAKRGQSAQSTSEAPANVVAAQSTLSAPDASASTARARRRAWMEVPLASRMVASEWMNRHPMLQREARGKFRVRRPPRWFVWLFTLPIVVLGYLYARVWWLALDDSFARESIWWVAIFGLLLVTVLGCAIMGAGAFTRERESGAWESILLSLLPTHSIMLAKVLSPPLATAFYSLLLWPILLPCIRHLVVVSGQHSGASLTQAIACVVILAGAAWMTTSWAMACSWFCRKTAAATGWAIGSLFVLWVFAPLFLMRGSFDNWFVETMRFWHPVVAMLPIVDRRFATDYPDSRDSVLLDGFGAALGFFMIGALLLRWIHNGLLAESGLDRGALIDNQSSRPPTPVVLSAQREGTAQTE